MKIRNTIKISMKNIYEKKIVNSTKYQKRKKIRNKISWNKTQ